MKKKDLLKMLDHIGDNEEIYVAVPTGNYWGMIEAKNIRDCDRGYIEYSGYLQSLQVKDNGLEGDCKEAYILELGY